MTAVHDQRLFLAHLAQVVHHQAELHQHTHGYCEFAPWRVNTRAYLRPVTEHLAVSSVGDQLLGELEGEHVSGVAQKHPLGVINLRFEDHLSDCWVQVVHDHQHYGGSLTRTARILIDGISPGEGGRQGGYCLTSLGEQGIYTPAWFGLISARAATRLTRVASPHG